MSIKKNFNCDQCEASGSITIKTKEFTESDIAICPCCGAPLAYEDDNDEDEHFV